MVIKSVYPSPSYTKEQLKRLQKLGDIEIIDNHDMELSTFIENVKEVELLITVPTAVKGGFSHDLLSSLPKLKLISLVTVGYSGVDLKAAKANNILICNAKGSNSEAVAEHIWGMILSLSKRINESNLAMRLTGEHDFSSFMGQELFGKTIGIIGLGDIGKRVAQIANAFNMKVIGINKSGNPVDGVEMVSMSEIMDHSDVIAVCVPLNDETKNIIDAKALSQAKTNLILINCAREELVNKTDVIEAVKNHKIAGYGVERNLLLPISTDDDYLKYPNILITPHTAFFTKEADLRSNEYAIENIEAYIKGQPIRLIA